MASADVTYTFSASTEAESAQVNTNFQDLVDFINDNCIQADGSLAMSGELTLSGNATTDTGAVPKQQLDARVPTSFSTYTPTLRQNGTAVSKSVTYCKYVTVGPMTLAWVELTCSASGPSGGGALDISLPVSHTAGATSPSCGGGRVFRLLSFSYLFECFLDSSSSSRVTCDPSTLVSMPQLHSGDTVSAVFEYPTS